MIQYIHAMVFASLLGAIGQIFLKMGSDKPLPKMIGYLLIFGALYGIAVIINIWVYRAGMKVSIAYPIISCSYIFAALLAWKVLDEPISALTIIGIAFIVLGVSLIGFGAVGATGGQI